MASMTMTASLLGGVIASERPSTRSHRRCIVAKASGSTSSEGEAMKNNWSNEKKERSSSSNNGRRELMLAAAATAACSIAGVAFAEEPKPGTPDAKKLYAPVCVTMPTARICHK